MISAGASFEDWQKLLPGGTGTLRNAAEEIFIVAQELLCQEFMTSVRQLPQNKLFTNLHDTVSIYLKVQEIPKRR